MSHLRGGADELSENRFRGINAPVYGKNPRTLEGDAPIKPSAPLQQQQHEQQRQQQRAERDRKIDEKRRQFRDRIVADKAKVRARFKTSSSNAGGAAVPGIACFPSTAFAERVSPPGKNGECASHTPFAERVSSPGKNGECASHTPFAERVSPPGKNGECASHTPFAERVSPPGKNGECATHAPPSSPPAVQPCVFIGIGSRSRGDDRATQTSPALLLPLPLPLPVPRLLVDAGTNTVAADPDFRDSASIVPLPAPATRSSADSPPRGTAIGSPDSAFASRRPFTHQNSSRSSSSSDSSVVEAYAAAAGPASPVPSRFAAPRRREEQSRAMILEGGGCESVQPLTSVLLLETAAAEEAVVQRSRERKSAGLSHSPSPSEPTSASSSGTTASTPVLSPSVTDIIRGVRDHCGGQGADEAPDGSDDWLTQGRVDEGNLPRLLSDPNCKAQSPLSPSLPPPPPLPLQFSEQYLQFFLEHTQSPVDRCSGAGAALGGQGLGRGLGGDEGGGGGGWGWTSSPLADISGPPSSGGIGTGTRTRESAAVWAAGDGSGRTANDGDDEALISAWRRYLGGGRTAGRHDHGHEGVRPLPEEAVVVEARAARLACIARARRRARLLLAYLPELEQRRVQRRLDREEIAVLRHRQQQQQQQLVEAQVGSDLTACRSPPSAPATAEPASVPAPAPVLVSGLAVCAAQRRASALASPLPTQPPPLEATVGDSLQQTAAVRGSSSSRDSGRGWGWGKEQQDCDGVRCSARGGAPPLSEQQLAAAPAPQPSEDAAREPPPSRGCGTPLNSGVADGDVGVEGSGVDPGRGEGEGEVEVEVEEEVQVQVQVQGPEPSADPTGHRGWGRHRGRVALLNLAPLSTLQPRLGAGRNRGAAVPSPAHAHMAVCATTSPASEPSPPHAPASAPAPPSAPTDRSELTAVAAPASRPANPSPRRAESQSQSLSPAVSSLSLTLAAVTAAATAAQVVRTGAEPAAGIILGSGSRAETGSGALSGAFLQAPFSPEGAGADGLADAAADAVAGAVGCVAPPSGAEACMAAFATGAQAEGEGEQQMPPRTEVDAEVDAGAEEGEEEEELCWDLLLSRRLVQQCRASGGEGSDPKSTRQRRSRSRRHRRGGGGRRDRREVGPRGLAGPSGRLERVDRSDTECPYGQGEGEAEQEQQHSIRCARRGRQGSAARRAGVEACGHGQRRHRFSSAAFSYADCEWRLQFCVRVGGGGGAGAMCSFHLVQLPAGAGACAGAGPPSLVRGLRCTLLLLHPTDALPPVRCNAAERRPPGFVGVDIFGSSVSGFNAHGITSTTARTRSSSSSSSSSSSEDNGSQQGWSTGPLARPRNGVCVPALVSWPRPSPAPSPSPSPSPGPGECLPLHCGAWPFPSQSRSHSASASASASAAAASHSARAARYRGGSTAVACSSGGISARRSASGAFPPPVAPHRRDRDRERDHHRDGYTTTMPGVGSLPAGAGCGVRVLGVRGFVAPSLLAVYAVEVPERGAEGEPQLRVCLRACLSTQRPPALGRGGP